ncbi:MAG TPA: YdeI/OmpD-associated family protein [Candidatus Kapabacteria bacterium]|jgi:uncharacterized protein YdeI (YjbR/CyaY-like superfamily)|nr:YdeI/OmpD-associated family protein [Candidatus Kapabacteria bacterium]
MGTKDPRVDQYIAKSADFARPILEHIREIVHETCPDVEETMKWSFPHFDYLGSMMCSMASFKAHCAFTFWKGSLIFEEGQASRDAMGHFGRITRLKDLPSRKQIAGYIRTAMKLNEEGITITRSPAEESADLEVPEELEAALRKNREASKHFSAFTPGRRKEYITWIAEAKTDATRVKRVSQAVEWIAEGKSRNWKYER